MKSRAPRLKPRVQADARIRSSMKSNLSIVGDVDPLSFPRIKRRSGLLPDHDDGVKVIRPRVGDEFAKQP